MDLTSGLKLPTLYDGMIWVSNPYAAIVRGNWSSIGRLRYQNSNSEVKSEMGLPTKRGLLYELLIM
jgi:hypothetical protein